jgi:hypothetical protein
MQQRVCTRYFQRLKQAARGRAACLKVFLRGGMIRRRLHEATLLFNYPDLPQFLRLEIPFWNPFPFLGHSSFSAIIRLMAIESTINTTAM